MSKSKQRKKFATKKKHNRLMLQHSRHRSYKEQQKQREELQEQFRLLAKANQKMKEEQNKILKILDIHTTDDVEVFDLRGFMIQTGYDEPGKVTEFVENLQDEEFNKFKEAVLGDQDYSPYRIEEDEEIVDVVEETNSETE